MHGVRTTWQEALTAVRSSPREVGGLLAVAVFALASYGYARPATESLFLERYGSQSLPWVWLAVAVGAVAVTWVYNCALATTPLARLWPKTIACTLVVGGGLVASEALHVQYAAAALYVWKDLYIVILVELFWSIANVSFPLRRARWLYGLFLVAGSLGSMCAELTVGWIADALGTVGAIGAVLPCLLIAAALTPLLPDAARTVPNATPTTFTETVTRGVRVLTRSRFLGLLVALVVLVQIAITLIDYQYNVAIEAYAPDMDDRTGVAGKLYAAISVCSLVLQLMAGVALKAMGVPLVLLLIPTLLLVGTVSFALSPRFGLMAAVKVASKALDYSLGRATKEILYIPLSYREKTEGKAAVDLLSYRLAKAIASFVLLWLASRQLGAWVLTCVLLVLLVTWLAVAFVIGTRFRDRS